MEAEVTPKPELSLRRVLAQIWGTLRASWRLLLLAGLVVFAPVTLIDTISPFDEVDVTDPKEIPLIFLALGATIVPLLGTVFYSGVVADAVMRHRDGRGHEIRHIARTLPYVRLALVDIALILVAGVGFILLVVPGFVILVWFSLVAPAVKIEGLGVRRAFGRSRELIRQHFWKAAGLVIPAVIIETLLDEAGDWLVLEFFEEGFLADWLAALAGSLLSGPVFAVVVVILFLDLRAEAQGHASPGS